MSLTRFCLALICVTGLLAIAAATSPRARAMRIDVSGDQLILAGPVMGDEFRPIERILNEDPAINTVILRNSPGGDVLTGYRVGEMFRARDLRTAVSGYCYSSCSRMFLGGKIRVFTGDYPSEYTNVGFHGHYGRDGSLNAALVQHMDLKNWIVKFSDGKADPALVERWINIPVNRGMIHFYYPTLSRDQGAATYFCMGNEPAHSIFACETEPRTALDLGVITSLDIIASNDQSALRAAFPSRPAPSGFASIEDTAKLPLVGDAGRRNYARYLTADPPKAFAISRNGRFWGWASGAFDAMQTALSRCAGSAGSPCMLYAVDADVVWQPTTP
jgi:hypothetical protein